MHSCHTVTVIVPIYGSYHRMTLVRCVLERWRAQTAAPEVILSYQGFRIPEHLSALAKEVGVPMVTSIPDGIEEMPQFNPGRLRNAGILQSKTDLIYITDADVAPLSLTYIGDILNTYGAGPKRALIKPKMFRVLEEYVYAFVLWGLHEKTYRIHEQGQHDFCLAKFECGMLMRPCSPQVFHEDNEGRYVCTADEYAVLKGVRESGEELPFLVMRPDVHWGGLLAPRSALLEVAGYSERYHGWGCEDDDLHLKLQATCGCELLRLPGAPRPLAHAEHPRYFNNDSYKDNRKMFIGRKQRGEVSMVQEDLTDSRSLFGSIGEPAPLRWLCQRY